MLPFSGFTKTTLIDYSPHVAATIFLSGCNMRCPWCHNPSLNKKFSQFAEDQILEELQRRKNFIDGVCITGGEPTLYKELFDFAKKIKAMGLLLKIDTNGTHPKLLKSLLDSCLVDKIAMDFKAPFYKYETVCGWKGSTQCFEESIEILQNSDIEWELRTTVIPKMINLEDLENMAVFAQKAPIWHLQGFVEQKNLLDPEFDTQSLNPDVLKEYHGTLQKKFPHCSVQIR